MKEHEIISTPFGNAQIRATSADRIFLDANGWGDGFTVNRVNMRVSAHFSLSKGRWQHYEQDHNGHCPYLYTSRKDGLDRVSFAAIKKLSEQLPAVVSKWAEVNSEALQQAERSSVMLDIENKEEEIKYLNQQMVQGVLKLKELRGRLSNVAKA